MKTKTKKILLSIVTLLASILVSVIGRVLLGDSGFGSGAEFLCRLCFILVPIFVVNMIAMLFRKEEKTEFNIQ